MAPHRLTFVILAMVGLFLAALIGLRWDSLQQDRDVTIARAAGGMRHLAHVAEQYAQRVFETSELVAGQVAARVADMGGVQALRDSVGVHHWLQDLSASSAGDYVMVVDATGQAVAASYAFPTPRVDFSDRRWFRAHAEGTERHVGQALHSRITNEILFTYSRLLRRPDGSFDGAVQIAVRTGFFQQQALAAEFGSNTAIGLYDLDGHVLARTGLTIAQLDITMADAVVKVVRSMPEGTLTAVGAFDGRERIISFRRLQDWPVVVTASVPLEEVLAPWWGSVRWSVEMIGTVAIGLTLFAALAIRMANREATARTALATANAALRDAASELEARVAARTRDLAASETRFRVIFDSTFQLIALLDAEGRVVEGNETTQSFLGLPRGALIGRHFPDLPCWPDAETRAQFANAIAAAAGGEARRWQMLARAGDGRLAPVEVSLRPVRDAEGRIAWLIVEGHDLTELKAAEARLREAQKMEALGQLTGGVAHDFNNLLMVVLGNLGLLRKRLPPDPRLLRLLEGAQQGAERGAALTSRMLAFARRQELRPAPVDLPALIEGLKSLLERSAGPTVRFELNLPEGLPPAMVDANQLELALLNLTVNARDAMPQGGTIGISASTAEAPADDAPPGLMPGPYLRLALRDSGTGMDAETLARATEPFFTTKGVGRGSGLGLSMVQGLAQQSGGGLRITSAPGQGTMVEIWLPRASAAAALPAASSPAPREGAPAPPRHILVVDDDPLVAAGTAMMLEDIGHTASVATSAREALARLGRDPSVELVLTDHAMPGMTGLELAEQLRRERPDLPVALATGFAELANSASLWLPRLNKPYRQEELEALVRRLTPAKAA